MINKLLNPLVQFWILAFLAFIFFMLEYRRVGLTLAVVAVLDLFLFTVSPLPQYLMRRLEQKYPVLEKVPSDVNEIVVLGGGHVNDPTLPALHKLSTVSAARLNEGIRLYNSRPGLTMVFSGDTGCGKEQHGVVASKAALELGVNIKDTLILVRPKTTWDEANEFKKRFGTDKRFVVVTSASHMPRAIETFKLTGLNPVAAPANYQIRYDPDEFLYDWWPSAQKVMYTERAMHEYIGLLYYRWFK